MIWLKFGRRVTGLRWDPRSFADLVVLLERSNALDEAESAEPPVLGHWRTNARPNEVFLTYGISEKEARRNSLEDGHIREKAAALTDDQDRIMMPVSRFSSDPDSAEQGGDQRHSREKMLPRATGSDDSEGSNGHGGGPLPWFLLPIWTSLWAITAIVLLLAFLTVSYLPSTRIRNGFEPDVPALVNTLGFSTTNFLYSFVPALLGMMCLLLWLEIDYAHRRLAVLEALAKEDGELPERSLLQSYSAEFPGGVTATALVNGHYRVALLSFVSLIAATLPILGGGVFWAQFIISAQITRISTHMPAYYALTVLCVLYALSHLLIFPSGRFRRAADLWAQHQAENQMQSFADVLGLVRSSKMLEDVAFHSPASKTDLVTRLLSAPPGARIPQLGGFGVMSVPRYGLGRFNGRGGEEFVGVDRVAR